MKRGSDRGEKESKRAGGGEREKEKFPKEIVCFGQG